VEELALPDSSNLLRILIVDANEQDGQHLLDALRGGGYDVYARRMCDGEEVAEALRVEDWDIVLLDCAVPDLSAAEAIDLIRPLAADLPIVLTIAPGCRNVPVELLENGASDLVFKSNPSRLLAVVERECSRLRLLREQQAAPGLPPRVSGIDEGEARFLQLASNTPECYWLVEAETQRVTYVSKGYEQIWGRYVEALYADRRDWLKHVHEDDRASLLRAAQQHRLGGLDAKFRIRRPGGSIRWLHARTFPVHNENGLIVSVGGVASDITSLVTEQGQSPFFAHFDALTALPNQLMFYDQARRLIALAKRKSLPVGVMVVDIDHFREVNQTLGHMSGDELLRQVAGRLSGLLRESDILGRLGGDVFAVLLPDVEDTSQAAIVARRVIDALLQPVRVEGQDIFVTASLGLVFHPQDGSDAHELVSNAEIAVRHAKMNGRNNYQFYSALMHDDVRDRLFLETDLRNAIVHGEFMLYYQAKVSCENGRVTGAEALLRWNHPRRGVVPPDQFIPLLEETGLIIQVGRWVLQEACRQAVIWQQSGLDIPSVSVNLSARQLQSETLLDDIADTLKLSGLAPACLDLEITESMLMQNPDAAVHMLRELKEMGVTLSLDDFGTGYSSLAYLKRFPLDALKVDRSFVQDIAADADDASITRAVITMAHHLKLKVVAEGVETVEQLALLISHQCDIIQGYYFSRPLGQTAMGELLGADKRLPANLLRSGTRQPMALLVAVDAAEEAISMLERDGHRVCVAADCASATAWLAGNGVDVLVCGPSNGSFDAAAVIRQVAQVQPQCERILLSDERAKSRRQVAELGAAGLLHRVIPLPLASGVLHQAVEAALERRRVTDDYGRLSREVEAAGRELLRIEEERRHLLRENEALRETGGQGYLILQELLAHLPWPVIGIDNDGMLALVNEAAHAVFPGRSLLLGASLADVLPEMPLYGDEADIEIAGRRFICRWRQFRPAGSVSGRFLLLEEK